VRAPLFRAPYLGSAVSSYFDERATVVDVAERRRLLRFDVARVFLDVLEKDALVRAAAAVRARADERARIAAARVREGDALPVELDEALALALGYEAALVETEGALHAARAELSLRAGIDEPLAPCAPCLLRPVVPAGPDLDRALADARGDVAAARARALARRVDEGAHIAAFLPTLDAVGTVRAQQPSLFNPDPVTWNAQLVLTWDILNGLGPFGSNRAIGTLQADRRAAREDARAELILHEARTAVATAETTLVATERAAFASDAALAAARRALAGTEARYEAGEASLFEVNLAADRAALAERDALRTRFASDRAALALRLALGLDVVDDGAPPPRPAPSPPDPVPGASRAGTHDVRAAGSIDADGGEGPPPPASSSGAPSAHSNEEQP
jgi:outer membrane protein TolC